MSQRVTRQHCVLMATAISGRLHGLLGEIVIAQTYRNIETVNIEAVFTFPVPVEAVLLGVDIRIDDRVLQGRVLPRRAADGAYEDAISGGDSAILLQASGRGLYTINIGNLLPGQTARLRYRYTLLSVWNGDTLRLQLPTTIAPRYGDPGQAGLQPHQVPAVALDAQNRFSMELELGGSLCQAVVESPSHQISVEAGAGLVRVRLASESGWMDRDFILNIRAAAAARAAFGLYAPDRDGWLALASLQPDLSDQVDDGGRDCVLIADCSGSMGGDAITQTRAALLAILDRLQPADRFNLIAFGSRPHAFFTGLQAADDGALAQGRVFVAGLDAGMGGTEIGAALQLAYQQGQGQPLDILLMTDGDVWNVEQLATDARRSGSRIFAVGVGAAVAEGLVRGLADATGGACEFVHPNEDMAARVVRHFERIRAPRAQATITWPGEPTRRLPEQVGRVFSGDTLHLLAWLPTPPAGPATLYLTLGDGQRLSQAVVLEPWPVTETADTLPRLAAARRIAELPAADAAALAVEYQLVTPYTHLLMLDVRADGEKAVGLPELRTVPQMLAAGWGGLGSLAGGRELQSLRRVFYADLPCDADILDLSSLQGLPFPPAPMTVASVGPMPSAQPPALLFARWLEVNAARLADPQQPLPTLADLGKAGLADQLLAQLQQLVAQGEAEGAVVAAMLHAFLQYGPESQLARDASRKIRARAKKQVSATLAAVVAALVQTWCATG